MPTTTQRRRRSIPSTPRVISPSPTPSDRKPQTDSDSAYNGPMTRSARKRLATPVPVEEDKEEEGSSSNDEGATKKGATNGYDLRRARTRSRSPVSAHAITELTPAPPSVKKARKSTKKNGKAKTKRTKNDTDDGESVATNGSSPKLERVQTNGHLQPPSQLQTSSGGGWSWRDLSRSPSPLGLIPIHRHWRTFVHKHEVPRKLLHVSIGFFVMWLYASGTQTRSVCPYLMGALIPIASIDLLRHKYAPFNRLYVRVLGALMRESEYEGYNGVIFYLLGTWTVLYTLPKDVGVVSVLLLSWCDTAASTFGRLYGRYTWRLRRGKSFAGSSAACVVGVATAAWFWGWAATRIGPMPGDEDFMFKGTLGLPASVVSALSLPAVAATRISGPLALGVVSVWSGLAASLSELVDLFGWDDNLTIPVLSGLGIWSFLKVVG